MPSYATPAWVLVTVLGAGRGAGQGAGHLEMEKQPASLLEQSVQDQILERPAGAAEYRICQLEILSDLKIVVFDVHFSNHESVFSL